MGGGEEARLHPDYVLLSNRLSGRGGGGGGGRRNIATMANSLFFLESTDRANGMLELWKTILLSRDTVEIIMFNRRRISQKYKDKQPRHIATIANSLFSWRVQCQWNVGTVENNTSEWERYF